MAGVQTKICTGPFPNESLQLHRYTSLLSGKKQSTDHKGSIIKLLEYSQFILKPNVFLFVQDVHWESGENCITRSFVICTFRHV
jgi:hypothetical protein